MGAIFWDKSEIVITHAVRSAIGKFCGALQQTSAVDLSVALLKSALHSSGLLKDVGRIVMGMARQAGAGPNPARQVQVFSEMPTDRTAWTLNMACGSGMLAVIQAAEAVYSGAASVVLAGGMENMSRVPYTLPQLRSGYRLGHSTVIDNMYEDGFHCRLANQLMGATAETLATDYAIGRIEQDAYAYESQQRYSIALQNGLWKEEIAPVTLQGRRGDLVFSEDEHPRSATTLEELSRLSPVFREGGTVTAGNSSGITDGSAFLVVMSSHEARKRGLSPLARIRGYAEAGVDPKRMGLGPVPATRALLQTAGLEMKDIDLVELNEAFAAQVISCERELKIGADRLNVNGGSIALGHPIGCTGARICVSLVHEMRRRRSRRGLATLCISGGQGLSVLFEGVAA